MCRYTVVSTQSFNLPHPVVSGGMTYAAAMPPDRTPPVSPSRNVGRVLEND